MTKRRRRRSSSADLNAMRKRRLRERQVHPQATRGTTKKARKEKNTKRTHHRDKNTAHTHEDMQRNFRNAYVRRKEPKNDIAYCLEFTSIRWTEPMGRSVIPWGSPRSYLRCTMAPSPPGAGVARPAPPGGHADRVWCILPPDRERHREMERQRAWEMRERKANRVSDVVSNQHLLCMTASEDDSSKWWMGPP